VNVMLISFNGSTTFKSVSGETQKNALIRNIVRQLIDASVDQTRITCSEEALDEHIGIAPFVLLIDELNALSVCLDDDAGSFLRRMFLDKRNRYLVFSTHVPMVVDEMSLNIFMTGSSRWVKTVCLPVSTDLKKLQQMPECQAINAATVALYGGIPSLIYSVFGLNEITPEVRFSTSRVTLTRLVQGDVDVDTLLKDFVRAVVTGDMCPTLELLFRFATTLPGAKMAWPICYIKCIIGLFDHTPVTRFILDECNSLEMHARTSGSGKDWESVINISLCFRCLHQQLFGGQGPFAMVDSGVKPLALALTLPGTCVTIEGAIRFLNHKLAPSTQCSLLLAVPSSSVFPFYDGFLAFITPSQQAATATTIVGFQAKLGKGMPKARDTSTEISRGLVLQGKANTGESQKNGWEYLNEHQIKNDVLVFSLCNLYPGSWNTSMDEDGGGGGGGGGESKKAKN
jgi:hypothetical protein